ncbi:unnamed protein product [Aphanomyces euteiches]
MADDSTAFDSPGGESVDSYAATRKKNEGNGSSRSKRSRAESNLGLRPTNKRKKATSIDPVEDPNEPLDNEEVEILMQEKQKLMEQLEKYSVVADISSEAPNLTRRSSLTGVVAPESTASFRHWDFLLQEMQWMATDFSQERKWRVRKAKTLSLSVTSYYNKKATANARNRVQEEQNRKRFAAKIGRDVKKFWLKVDKLVAHQVKTTEEERQKAAMEAQLQFLINQTEKYAAALANTFALDKAADSEDESMSQQDAASESDFECSDPDVLDDESTIEAEEQAQSKADVDMEVALLNEESTMSIEELRQMYAADPLDDPVSPENESDYGDDAKDEEDDESTIEVEEKAQSKADVDDEVALLNEESDLPIEELRAKHATNQDEEEVPRDDDSDYGDDDSVDGEDDESTIEAEEKAQSKTDVDEEVALLNVESTMSIEELRAKYATLDEEPTPDDESDYGDDVDIEEDAENTIEAEERAQLTADADEDAALLDAKSTKSIEELRAKKDALDGQGIVDAGSDYSDDDEEEDDETTIEAEENAQSKAEVDEELALLNEESTMSIEELRAKYAQEEDALSAVVEDNESGEMDNESEYSGNGDSDDGDDETTIEAAEKAQSREDIDEELSRLEVESTMSIEQLRAKYQAIQDESQETGKEEEDNDEPTPKTTSVVQTVKLNDTKSSSDDVWERVGLERPFLLRPTLQLRAYQATGVAWLLSLAHNRMNGILADEMGLGKTIQTISMLASLAMEGIWGPHLVVVPTSCILNWEMEFKRWCPGFKIMTYYGSAKRRKELRSGWSKVNAFQVCITSYQLIVADAPCFKRKKWYYLILDEAHNIKNWKSQRWQTLLTFNTQRRLLLTGTPLQNNLMELWSLMHFLMPHLFRSRAQFSHWFHNPLNAMVEGETAVNDHLVSRLHNIIRPFVLRRLKKDVAKQMPGKFEHIVMCSLSKRQRFLYEDFMARSATRKALSGGNFMGMMNVLMQLRKVCNHPDLFEPRPISSPFDMAPLEFHYPFALSTFQATKHRLVQPPEAISSHWASAARVALTPSVKLFVEDVALEQPDENVSDPLLMAFLADQLCTMPTFISPAMEMHQMTDSCALKCMVRTPTERLEEWLEVLPKILCFVHKARTPAPDFIIGSQLSAGRVRDSMFWRESEDKIRSAIDPIVTALHPIHQRQHLFFPDKRLIQFDCGKLQQLDRLLRDLKRGNHRCLIFSQMSSMLNILEIFLNVHGHTYFRLDGSTPVERRQRLMDKFNSDPKVFCFILSTRSGGLGINLTGADTVIFYDSDWNPAMDAQAQDRAHRIGQTRDVHIYRMVSEHTVEENILKKAQQKRHLDFLVLSEGQFTTDYFTKANLRDLIGKSTEPTDETDGDEEPDVSTIEDAMAQCEDQEDVAAMKVVKLEQREEKEQDDAFDDEETPSVDSSQEISSAALIEQHLRPIDKYAMGFRTTTDPLFQYVAFSSMPDEAQEELELERIEANKIVDEEMAIQEGELIAAAEFPIADQNAQKHVYKLEKSHVKRERRRRALTGSAWQQKTCARSNLPFFYNVDTHEAIWDRPHVLVQIDEEKQARLMGYQEFENNAGIVWHSKGGQITGLHIQMKTTEKAKSDTRATALTILSEACCTVSQCKIGGGDSCVVVQGGTGILIENHLTHAMGSGVVVEGGLVAMLSCVVTNHGLSGLSVIYGAAIVRKNSFEKNSRYGIRLLRGVVMAMLDSNTFLDNGCGAMDIETPHRRILIRQSHILPIKERDRPHFHARVKLKGEDLWLQDVCAAKPEKVVKVKKPKVEKSVDPPDGSVAIKQEIPIKPEIIMANQASDNHTNSSLLLSS